MHTVCGHIAEYSDTVQNGVDSATQRVHEASNPTIVQHLNNVKASGTS